MSKIYVTPYESLDPYYNRRLHSPLHEAPEDKINIDEDDAFVGTHDVCRGIVTVIDVAELVRAMTCQCGLRVLFPKTLKTVADLRQWAKKGWQMPMPELTEFLNEATK
jgi:hypothetical protein